MQSKGLGRRPLDCFAALAMTAICVAINESLLSYIRSYIRNTHIMGCEISNGSITGCGRTQRRDIR